jgi:hypothetical protein
MGKSYKVKLFTSTEKGNEFTDFYVDADDIKGCYKPSKAQGFPDDMEAINIFHGGGISTILEEKHIGDYLYDRFVKNCVELKD